MILAFDVSCETFVPDDETLMDAAIMPLAAYSPYYATIPEPYLTYLRSYATGISPWEDYVCYVTQESKYVGSNLRTSTVYNIAIGDLNYNGFKFTGDVVIHKIYATPQYFGQFVSLSDNSFELIPSDALVYSSIRSEYPDITTQSIYSKYAFFLMIFVMLLLLLRRFFHG